MGLPVLSAAPVTIRHIKIGAAGASSVVVLGATLVPQPRKGVNGRRGYQSGTYETALNEEGTATLTLPNTVGDDGILHRRRFLLFTADAYHPGDEWIEVSQSKRVLFVGTPIAGQKTRGQVTVNLGDGSWLLRKERETAAGFWTHSPRDVFEHYTKAWRTIVADDFTFPGADPAKWTKVNTTDLADAVRLNMTSAPTQGSITAISTFWGWVAMGTERDWRLELEYDMAPVAISTITVALVDKTSGTSSASMQLLLTSPATGLMASITIQAGGVSQNPATTDLTPALVGGTLAIESRDRWIHFYFGGQLIGSLENTDTSDTGRLCVPKISYAYLSGPGGGNVDVKSVLLRRADPYLMRGTDAGAYRLPGSPPSGGLQGTYFDDVDLGPVTVGTIATVYARVLAPIWQPYARRQDATINFPTASPGWQPAGPAANQHFSARWTGSIFLDLATADVTLQFASVEDAMRLWVGKTMFGQQLLDYWTTTGATTLTTISLRTHLGSISGWYPIRLEHVVTDGGGIVMQQSIGGGAYATVPATSLSPYGIYETNVRYDSHTEQLKAIAETFGYQFRLEPRSLESGLFPGEMVPRVRVGRDTDKILEPKESTDVSIDVDAADVCDTLLADAAGISDPTNAAQLTAENINYTSILEPVVANRHMMVLSEYESLTDITDPGLLATRLDSMQTLRSTPWEEVGARPRGFRERRDTFPLTGALAAFAWEPGDGIRIQDPDLDLNDVMPRQIIAPSWPFGPDGLGSPSVRFRQRPRSQQDALRALMRLALLPQRNYQGTLVTVTGSSGSVPAGSGAVDAFSRASLPMNIASVVRAELVVQSKSDTSTQTIAINGAATTLTLTARGRYDITPYVARNAGTAQQRIVATVTGGTGNTEFALELLVSV
jgi:hypothetical protein